MKAYRSLTASRATWSLVFLAATACGRAGQRADAGADLGSTVGSGGTMGAGGSATGGAGGADDGGLGGSPGSGGANAGGGGQASGGAVGAGGAASAGGAGGAEASDGSVIDAGPEVQPVRKRVFHLVNGALGKIKDSGDTRTGLETADAACTTAGKMHGGGQWRAWLSSSSMNAMGRLADVGPWYRLDQQTMLFENRAAIAQGPLVPIEDSSDSNARVLFWSGTLLDGTASAANCTDWTEYVGGVKATVGRADTAGPGWVVPTLQSCSTYLSLLCFEQ